MTTVAAMICADGLVMGSDTKVVSEGSGIKWSANKLTTAMLGDSPLVIGCAGRLRHMQDAIGWMSLDELGGILGADTSFDKFLDAVVERAIPAFSNDYRAKYGVLPELEMLIGCIDTNDKPRLVNVYADGDYDYVKDCIAIGSGSIFGEILQRKLYTADINVKFAKRLIGYIIWEIQAIDNNSGEDMQIVCIGCDKKQYEASNTEVAAYKQLPDLLRKSYNAIRHELEGINIDSIEHAIESMRGAIGLSEIPSPKPERGMEEQTWQDQRKHRKKS